MKCAILFIYVKSFDVKTKILSYTEIVSPNISNCTSVNAECTNIRLTLFILNTDKQVLWQKVKTQMKCCIWRHFRVLSVYEDKSDLKTHYYYIKIWKFHCVAP